MGGALTADDVIARNNVRDIGQTSGRPILFAHGFGCNQNVWRDVVPAFLDTNRVILFDHVGAGGSDLSAYDTGKYDALYGYADDLLEIMNALDLQDVVFVGHSVSSMIGILAANQDPSRFGALVLVGPSPRYVDQGEYIGGFQQADIDGLLDSLDAGYLDASAVIAPMIMGNSDRPELGAQLTGNFCETDPIIGAQFARVTFLSDHRRDLAEVSIPTLVVQSQDDAIAPVAVGQYVHHAIAGSDYVLLDATGHCPNLSAPDEVSAAIADFLR